MLNLAWRSYSRGDMDDVLVKCRKALEQTSTYVKKVGFKKKAVDKNGKDLGKIVPDWKKFFDNEDKGDIVGTIIQKTCGFTARGAHTGSILDGNHAYFILLQTLSLIHIVLSCLTLVHGNSLQHRQKAKIE